MKTAVEWLAMKLQKENTFDERDFFLIEQAKEMEKEQIIDAYWDGYTKPYSPAMITEAEQYYNETFKNK